MAEDSSPRLMIDNSDNDGHAETMMDYIISWPLRCAVDNSCVGKPILMKQCKKILCKLIGIDEPHVVEVMNVETWKQDQYIDLWVHVELVIDGKAESHAILIENKYYTGLHDATDDDGVRRNQLLVYRKRFDKYYETQEKEWVRHYCLITCIEREEPEKFEKYMRDLIRISKKQNKEYVFLTAWNEWGEGAYLEPDEENGYAYLEALKRAIDSVGD